MSKTFRAWDVDQVWLLPPSIQDLVPSGHVAHFVRDTVRTGLDLSAIMDSYDEERGFPPYHPGMMVALLLYAYSQGVYSSRRIARGCEERLDFAAVTGMQHPDFRTISEFRKRHLAALSGLFRQVLKLCREAGLVKLGHVALDGTKIKANAGINKAMSYGRMKEAEPRLAAEVQRWFAEAAQTDKAEDRRFGASKRGEEMPEWMANKEKRLEKIRTAKAALGAESRSQGCGRSQSRREAGRRRLRRRRQGPAGTQVRACHGRAERQGATQLHRSRQPRNAHQERVHPGLQRTGCRRWRPSDHRGAHADQFAERSGAVRTLARCHQSQSREEPG